MNFKEWYETMPKLDDNLLAVSKVSWNACKKEVLRILKENISFNGDEPHLWRSIDFDVLDKIENL